MTAPTPPTDQAPAGDPAITPAPVDTTVTDPAGVPGMVPLGETGEPAHDFSVYGHMGTLTEEQAAAFHMMMMILGHDANTVGKGRVIELPTNGPAKKVGPAKAAL